MAHDNGYPSHAAQRCRHRRLRPLAQQTLPNATSPSAAKTADPITYPTLLDDALVHELDDGGEVTHRMFACGRSVIVTVSKARSYSTLVLRLRPAVRT